VTARAGWAFSGYRFPDDVLALAVRWCLRYRAIDEHGQVIDVYATDHRDAASARAFFECAIAATGMTPTRVASDKAKCCPPALRAVVPAAEQRSSKDLDNGLERGCGRCGASK
jgi:transposase, IS6 family